MTYEHNIFCRRGVVASHLRGGSLFFVLVGNVRIISHHRQQNKNTIDDVV
jgi:hypothetical protein